MSTKTHLRDLSYENKHTRANLRELIYEARTNLREQTYENIPTKLTYETHLQEITYENLPTELT